MRKFPHFNYTPQGCAGQKGGSQTKKAWSLPKGGEKKKKQLVNIYFQRGNLLLIHIVTFPS